MERWGLGADLGNDSPHRNSCSSLSDIDSPSKTDHSLSETLLRWHKHCSPLQPLRARHVLPVSLSSLIIRWMTPRSEQNSKSDSGAGLDSWCCALRLILLHDLDSTTKWGAGCSIPQEPRSATLPAKGMRGQELELRSANIKLNGRPPLIDQRPAGRKSDRDRTTRGPVSC